MEGVYGQRRVMEGVYSQRRVMEGVDSQRCQRLCWYRTICVAFSIPDDVTVADGEVNCLLHSGAANDVLPKGWTSQPASNRDIQHGCRLRPCTTSQICVPLSGLDVQYLCVELPVDCGFPTPPDNGQFNWTGTTPGHVATLSCVQYHGIFPKDASAAVTCTEQGIWTTLQASCRKVSYSGGVSVPFLKRLPSSLTLGWEACIKGKFLGGGHFAVNFLSNQEDYPNLQVSSYQNVIAQLSFRDSLDNIVQSLLYSEKINDVWTVIATIGDFPLTAGDDFSLTLHLNASCLNVRIQGTAFSACLPGPQRLPYINTVFIGIARSVELNYVNLYSSQDCL
ncbi:hypothetical protein ACOMHN_015871 [Nucella lapillus]